MCVCTLLNFSVQDNNAHKIHIIFLRTSNSSCYVNSHHMTRATALFCCDIQTTNYLNFVATLGRT